MRSNGARSSRAFGPPPEARRGSLERTPPSAHRPPATPHRPCRHRPRHRQQQPANPFGGQPRLRAQPPLDLLPPRVQTAGPRRRHPRRRLRSADGPSHRLDVQLQPPRNLLLRHALHQMQVADLGPLGHPDHLCVLPAQPTRRSCLAPSIFAGRSLSPKCSGGPFSRGHGGPFSCCRYQRSIPACAGKPWASRRSAVSRGVHPRVCGEAEGRGACDRVPVGPSPRVRGSQDGACAAGDHRGSIPACAGKPESRNMLILRTAVHPRVCGEAASAGPPPGELPGPSPRVRGSRRGCLCVADRGGSIPACAGKPPRAAGATLPAWVHPRVCGEAPPSWWMRE